MKVVFVCAGMGSATTATTTAATATAATTATGFAKEGIGADVAHGGLQRVRLTGALLRLARSLAVILIGATKTCRDALRALDEATVKSLLQGVRDAGKVLVILRVIARCSLTIAITLLTLLVAKSARLAKRLALRATALPLLRTAALRRLATGLHDVHETGAALRVDPPREPAPPGRRVVAGREGEGRDERHEVEAMRRRTFFQLALESH